MIREWVESQLTPCPPPVRQLGYVHELVAIGARHRRCQAAWADHLASSRRTIVNAIPRAGQRRTAMILGSGLLLDVPLAELAQAFQRVVLVDAVHPLAARWQVRRYANVEILAADITGVMDRLAAGGSLPVPLPFAPLHAPDIDFVVSLNLLSQLGVLPEEHLRARGGEMAQHAADYAALLTRAHLDDLARCRGTVCLISDIEWRHVDPEGNVAECGSSIFDVPPPPAAEDWLWNIAPAPEIDPRLSEQRRVIVALDPGKAPQAAG